MRLGQLDVAEYTKIANVEGLRGTRLSAGHHVELPELVALVAACSHRRVSKQEAGVASC